MFKIDFQSNQQMVCLEIAPTDGSTKNGSTWVLFSCQSKTSAKKDNIEIQINNWNMETIVVK